MNAEQLLLNAAKMIGKSGGLYKNEAINLLDKEKYILCIEKYGNMHILVGYNQEKEVFYKLSAPWGRSFGVWDMIRGINHLGIRTVDKYSFDDFNYFATEVRAFNWLEKIALKIQGIEIAIIKV